MSGCKLTEDYLANIREKIKRLIEEEYELRFISEQDDPELYSTMVWSGWDGVLATDEMVLSKVFDYIVSLCPRFYAFAVELTVEEGGCLYVAIGKAPGNYDVTDLFEGLFVTSTLYHFKNDLGLDIDQSLIPSVPSQDWKYLFETPTPHGNFLTQLHDKLQDHGASGRGAIRIVSSNRPSYYRVEFATISDGEHMSATQKESNLPSNARRESEKGQMQLLLAGIAESASGYKRGVMASAAGTATTTVARSLATRLGIEDPLAIRGLEVVVPVMAASTGAYFNISSMRRGAVLAAEATGVEHGYAVLGPVRDFLVEVFAPITALGDVVSKAETAKESGE